MQTLNLLFKYLYHYDTAQTQWIGPCRQYQIFLGNF